MKKLTVVILLSLLLISGCRVDQSPTPQPAPPQVRQMSPTQVAVPTEIPLPTAALPTLAPSPTFTPTPEAVLPIQASVASDNYILRAGPGRLFERVSMYSSGAEIRVLGRSMGIDWVMVQTADQRIGWMNTGGLDHLGDFSSLPIFKYPDAVMLSGHVWNLDGSPAQGIGMRLIPAGSKDGNQREDITTGADGAWYAYLPAGSSGAWEVHAVSHKCAADVPVEQCTINGNLPESMTISLPEALNVNIEMSMQP
jgi:hypothetical protein